MLVVEILAFHDLAGGGLPPRQPRAGQRWIVEHRKTPSLPVEEVGRGGGTWGRVREALRHRNVRLVVAMNFFFLWAETGVSSFLTTRFTSDVGVSLGVAAVLSGLSGATGWIGQVVWGALSDRRGRKLSLNILAIGWAVTVFAMMSSAPSPRRWSRCWPGGCSATPGWSYALIAAICLLALIPIRYLAETVGPGVAAPAAG